MNTQKELFDRLGGQISKSSIKFDGSEYVVVGKFGMVTFVADGANSYFDVWLCNPKDLGGKPLGTRKINNLMNIIPKHVLVDLDDKYDNEVTFAVPASIGYDFIAGICVTLGARKKRVLSEENRVVAARRLAKARAGRV